MDRARHSPAAASRSAILSAVVAIVWALATVATAQSAASVVIGYGGTVVAGAWNPVQVIARDAGAAVLEIYVDQGSLREGEIPYRYRAELPGGTGLVSFSDDVYLPSWRSLQWRLTGETRLLASGSLSARDADARPLHVVVSQRAGSWRSAYGSDARVLERNGPDLPTRAAAYDGVATLLLDGTTAPPHPEAVLAAAASGATVVLVGDLPGGYGDIELLATGERTYYGNGRVVQTDPAGVEDALRLVGTVDAAALRGVLAEHLALDPPPAMGTGMILLLAGGYVLALLLVIRFGRLPGVLAALALAAVASLAAWDALRPDQSEFRASATVEVGSGGLARRATVSRLLTLPAQALQVDGPAFALERRPLEASPSGVRVPLGRGGAATLATAPSVREQRLAWVGGVLENRSRGPLADVYVLGAGPQPPLSAGARATPGETEDAVLAPIYQDLIPLLPAGSALARAGSEIVIALVEEEPL